MYVSTHPITHLDMNGRSIALTFPRHDGRRVFIITSWNIITKSYRSTLMGPAGNIVLPHSERYTRHSLNRLHKASDAALQHVLSNRADERIETIFTGR